MPTIRTISAKTTVPASSEEVFSAVTNWELQHKWIFATKVSGIGDNNRKLGGKLEAFTGFGPFGFTDTMTITRWSPPNMCEVAHTGKLVKGSGVFEVTNTNHTTYFTWTEHIELPFGVVGRVGWPLIKPLALAGLKISLYRFKRML